MTTGRESGESWTSPTKRFRARSLGRIYWQDRSKRFRRAGRV